MKNLIILCVLFLSVLLSYNLIGYFFVLLAQRRPGQYGSDNSDIYLENDDRSEDSHTYDSNPPEQV